MATIKFIQHIEKPILFVDVAYASLIDIEDTAKKIGNFYSLYRRNIPLLVMYDIRGINVTEDLLKIVNKYLIKFSKKVSKRAFITESKGMEVVIDRILSKRKMLRDSYVTNNLLKALDFLATGRRFQEGEHVVSNGKGLK